MLFSLDLKIEPMIGGYNVPSLLEVRLAYDLSLREAAEHVGVALQTFCNAENGIPITKAKAKQICEGFNMPVEGIKTLPRRLKKLPVEN